MSNVLHKKLIVENVNLDDLLVGKRANYILVGDASLDQESQIYSWVCMVLDPKGNGEVLYGLGNVDFLIDEAEFLPYIHALFHLQALIQANDLVKENYPMDVLIFTDCKNIVSNSQGELWPLRLQGLWFAIEGLRLIFNLKFHHCLRNTHSTLRFVDETARHILRNTCTLKKTIYQKIQEHTTDFMRKNLI